MKKYEFDIKSFELNTFFPNYRMKNKTDTLKVLLEATRFMLVNEFKTKVRSDEKIVLLVDKMTRLFFFSTDRYYSIFFPFNVLENSNKIDFNFKNSMSIDAQSISILISILNDSSFNSSSSLDFADPIFELEQSFNDNIWIVLKELLLSEDGYIRYDADKEGFLKAKEDNREHLHPEHHYDIFYKNTIAIKFGLFEKCLPDKFIDSINLNTNCHYLKSSF